jgi:hypothetical protein
VRVH